MIGLECGGITEWLKMAHLVKTYKVPVASHTSTEVWMHLVAASGSMIVEYIPWMVPLFKEVPPVVDGFIELPQQPGLGVELDMQAVAHFGVDV